jgi:polysaccharide deacetylase family protein (PEP-CTERM system associated)
MASVSTQHPSPMALSVDVEDWFHTENMKSAVPRDSWDQCELRVERNTMRILEILDARNALATFFVLGWVAERNPKLVRAISAAGHEVASHGYAHELVYSLQPNDFRTDILRSKGLLEDLTGMPVRGYRAPCFSITEWAITILQEAGFEYDSSMVPTMAHDRYGQLDGIDIRKPIVLIREGFYEVCVSCLPVGNGGIPWGGGGYFRFIPYSLFIRGIHRIRNSGLPYIFYIHPWEIDPGQPRIDGMKATNQFRQRVNLDQCEKRFENLVGSFHWTTIGTLLENWHCNGPMHLDDPAEKRPGSLTHRTPFHPKVATRRRSL